VLHILAHLETTAHLPSSLYDPGYVALARRHLGDPAERALGADIEALSTHLVSHEGLIAIQPLLRLHPSLAAGLRGSQRSLLELDDDPGTNRAVRDALVEKAPLCAELLRCAALLEAETFVRWPLPDLTDVARRIRDALPAFWGVSPQLRCLPIRTFLALGMRGRAWPDEIWVGIPVESGEPSLEHVLWQAAHEATVLEVAQRTPLGERHIERLAVALMSQRATRSNMRPSYEQWLRNFDATVRDWANGTALSETDRQWLDGVALDPFEGTPER
jgi:hypothetical protein